MFRCSEPLGNTVGVKTNWLAFILNASAFMLLAELSRRSIPKSFKFKDWAVGSSPEI